MLSSEMVKELAQQCCDEIEGHCYREGGGNEYSYSSFDREKALHLIEVYMLRACIDTSNASDSPSK